MLHGPFTQPFSFPSSSPSMTNRARNRENEEVTADSSLARVLPPQGETFEASSIPQTAKP